MCGFAAHITKSEPLEFSDRFLVSITGLIFKLRGLAKTIRFHCSFARLPVTCLFCGKVYNPAGKCFLPARIGLLAQ